MYLQPDPLGLVFSLKRKLLKLTLLYLHAEIINRYDNENVKSRKQNFTTLGEM